MTDVLERARSAYQAVPSADEPERAARAALDAAIAQATTTAPRRPRRLVLVVGLIAGLALVAIAVVALAPGRSRSLIPNSSPEVASAADACTTETPAAASACLLAMRSLAATQPGPRPNSVWYERTLFVEAVVRVGPERGQNPARWRTLPGAKRVFQIARWTSEEVWVAPDGSGRISNGRQGAARPASAWDAAAWRAAGRPALARLLPRAQVVGPRVQKFRPGGVDQLYLGNSNLDQVLPKTDPLSVLPREPRALEDWLRNAAWQQRVLPGDRRTCKPSLRGCSDGYRREIRNTFGTDVISFLRYPRTDSQLRAALLQVLAEVRGARLLGLARDPRGRRAATIQLPAQMNDGYDVIAFDPDTSQLLAEGHMHGHRLDAIRWGRLHRIARGNVKRIGARPGQS